MSNLMPGEKELLEGYVYANISAYPNRELKQDEI